MADQDITFTNRIPFTTDLGALIANPNIGPFFQNWDFLPGTESFVTRNTDAAGLNVTTIGCNPKPEGEVAFPGESIGNIKLPFRYMYDSLFTQVGDTVNLATFTLAKGQYQTKLLLICTLTCLTRQHTSSTLDEFRAKLTITLRHDDGYGHYTDYPVYDSNFSTIRGDRTYSYYAFSFGFLNVPGRPEEPKNKIFCIFRKYCSGNTDPSPVDYPLSAYTDSGDTRTYNLNQISNVNFTNGAEYLVTKLDLNKIEVEWPDMTVTAEKFSDEAGPQSEPGGMEHPTFDDSSDTIAIPTAPTQNITGLGFFNVYRMSLASLDDLHNYIFGQELTSESTTEDILKAIGNNMFHSKLVDYIVSCHLIPVDPMPDATGVTAVNLGNKTLDDVTGVKCTTDYVDVTCGSINLAEYYENFADFLESCKLYLPFIGFVPVQPEWFKYTTLGVDYRFNIIDGSCVAFVTATGKYTNNDNSGGTIVAQYAGTASIRYPITGVSYASMATGVLGAVAGMSVAMGSGSLLGVAGSAVNMAQAKPSISQSNGYNSCSAMMGVRRPYLYIERPVSSYAENYQHEVGIPANIYVDSLGSVSGFVQMTDVHVDGIPGATDYEKAEIKRLLAQGVIV